MATSYSRWPVSWGTSRRRARPAHRRRTDRPRHPVVLSVVLGALKSEASAGDGTFSFHFSYYLEGAALALFLVLGFLYYFALEASIGRTVGKLLVGLQVVGPGQRRPPVWAVAVRTALRVVDWLPLLYLVGLITTLATGAHRQRLGDLAANTTVARAWPIRRRGLVATLLASCLVVAVGVSVVSGAVFGDDNTYRAHGVSFNYPAGWQDITDDIHRGAARGAADELWTLALGTAAFGAGDMVSVTAYRMRPPPVTAEDLDAIGAELTAILREVDWTVQAGPEEITVGGKPSLRYEATGSVNAKNVEATLVYVFDGLTEYQLKGQSTAEHRAEIEESLRQIMRTFKVD
jgi:uncharacterized RDD family membrane protein YckC